MFDEPKIEVLEVTPDLAHEWLGHNEGNRNVRSHQVNALARDMREGRWQFNGDSIRIAADGTLLDGQHRLLAVIKAGVPIQAVVISGLPRETQDTMDAGAKRSASDQLRRRGIARAPIVAGVALKMIYWDKHQRRRSFTGVTVTNAEIIDYCANAEFLATVDLAATYIKTVKAPPTVTAFCFCLFARIDTDAAIDFFDGLATGANLSPRDPILLLRDRLLNVHGQAGVVLNSERYIALFCKAWNYWRANRPMGVLKVPLDKEAYPEPR